MNRHFRLVANVSTYPIAGADHSSSQDLSALAGYTKSLLRNMPQTEKANQVILSNIKESGPKTYDDEGLEVRECWRKGSLFYAWDLWKEIRKNESWHIIHFQHEFNQFGGAWSLPLNLILVGALKYIARRKVAVTVHEILSLRLITKDFLLATCVPYPVFLVKFVLRIYYYLLAKMVSALVVQDEHFSKVLHDEYGVRNRIDIVRIGAEALVPGARLSSREKFGIGADEPVLLFFGTLDWRKGLDILLDSLTLIPETKFKLLIGGGKPRRIRDTEDYRLWWSKVEQKIISNINVIQVGFIDDRDIPLLFGAADLLVLPYVVPQRVSAVFNQAASYGKPLVVSSVFEDQAAEAMIFNPDPEALAGKITWAFDGHLEELKEWSLNFRLKNSWTASAAVMVELQKRLLGEDISVESKSF